MPGLWADRLVMGGMVPILLVLAIAFVTQSVPKPSATTAALPDTLQTTQIDLSTLTVSDSLDCEP